MNFKAKALNSKEKLKKIICQCVSPKNNFSQIDIDMMGVLFVGFANILD